MAICKPIAGLCALVFLTAGFASATAQTPAGLTPTRATDDALWARIESFDQMGLPYPALKLSQHHAAQLDDSILRRLEADYLAELTRLAAMPSRQESERYAIADRALAGYDRLVPVWTAKGAEARADTLRLKFDRLQALLARNRTRDIIVSYEALLSQGIQVPRYALVSVASAYLDLRQPHAAAELYRQINADPAAQHDNANERLRNATGLFYALLEQEEYEQAMQTLQQERARHPAWRTIKGVPQPVPNELYLDIEHLDALALFYVNDTPGAQARLEKMVERAPRSMALRTSLANVYRSRGWARRAEKELKIAESLEPRAVELEAGQGRTALDLQEWQQAELLTQDLVNRYPEMPATQHLKHEWDRYKKAELRVLANRGLASDSPVSGSRDLSLETVLYSAPVNHNWRFYGGAGYATADFEEGRGDYRWLRAGAEWRGRDLTAEIEASIHRYGYGIKPGARFAVAYDLSDHWQVGTSASLRSRDTPLRALRNGVYSNDVSAYLNWRQSERREWRFTLSPAQFSDGNTRWTALISGSERLYTNARFKADLLLNLYATRNSRQDAPYFNPRADLEFAPSLKLTHTLYQRYETKLEHSLLLTAGTYSQRGYGTGAVGAIGYGILYTHDDRFEIGANIVGASRPYDGVREREVRIMLEITARF